MGRGLDRHFFKDIQGQRAHEKMLNVISHKGNENQNHNEIALQTHSTAGMKIDNNKRW